MTIISFLTLPFNKLYPEIVICIVYSHLIKKKKIKLDS